MVLNFFVFLLKLVISTLNGLAELCALDHRHLEVNTSKFDNIIDTYLMRLALGLEPPQDIVC